MLVKKRITALLMVIAMVISGLYVTTDTSLAASWYWPIGGYSSATKAYAKITSSYGNRGGSFNGRMHYGVDIGEAKGTPVLATRAGVVYSAKNDTSGSVGRRVIINHQDGYYSTYMHLSKVNVTTGQKVSAGQVIGAVGGSGNGSENGYANHLHFQIHKGGVSQAQTINPCPPGYTKVGASFSQPGGKPVGTATISYLMYGSGTTSCSHTYTTGSEALHPHKEYKKCTKCGYTYYTGVNYAGKISSCSTCKGLNSNVYFVIDKGDESTYKVGENVKMTYYLEGTDIYKVSIYRNGALYKSFNTYYGVYNTTFTQTGHYSAEIIATLKDGTKKSSRWVGWNIVNACAHTYTTGSEALHPHKEYKKCTKCGYTYYTGVNFAGKISSCSTCRTVTNTINLTSTIPDDGITVGTDFKFAGTVTSSHNVANVTATLKNASNDDKWYFDSGSINVKSYDLSALNSKFNIAKLPVGTYYLEIKMSNVGSTVRHSNIWRIKIVSKSCSHVDVQKYETAHPHKEFLECKLCGRKEYTGRNQKVSSCEICNPKEETHECSYTLYYETEHPHEGYYRCDVCGNQKSAGIYGEEDWCEECFPGVKAVEFELKKEIDSVVLEWDKDGFFEEGKYYLYRSVNGEPFEIIEEGQDICEYTDRDIKPGSIYQYYVEVKKDGSLIAESNIHETSFSEVSDLKSNVQNIKIKTLKAKKSKSKITLSWKKSTAKYRVDGYIVLRASSKGGTYTKIFTTKKQSIVTKKLPKKGKSYYYKVRGYRKIDGRTVYTKSAVVRVKG